jgi:hypothetical protein
MSTGIENHIDWTIPATPHGEHVGPGLARQAKPRATAAEKRSVMDTLLGENNLAAHEVSGADPYNATGRQFRR